ncbi:MAG: T9SS type A sorting domain-containing protein [Bacteroidota bacterium]
MKKILLGLSLIFAVTQVSAKKVKFAVDMTGQTISAFGVHIVGDFQEAAGYPLNWDPAATTLTQEGATNIYSIIVAIPAFTKYEYLFVNGDQTYEAEFVPDESRVGYNFDDNRWLYVDSLANDTSFVGAILFGGNAPSGFSLVRYKVDMANALPVSPNGVHVGDNMNSFSTTKVPLYSFGNDVYEIISYYQNSSYAFKYYNGNTISTGETISGPCDVFGNRGLTVTKDTVMSPVCFSSCSLCSLTSIKEHSISNLFNVFPNPAKNKLTIQSAQNDLIEAVIIYNIAGQQVKHFSAIHQHSITFDELDLPAGLYTVKVSDKDKSAQHLKLIIE